MNPSQIIAKKRDGGEYELSPERRRRIFRQSLIPFTLLLAVAWGVFALRWLLDIDLFVVIKGGVPAPVEMYGWLALGTSAVAVVWTVNKLRLKLILATRGVPALGVICSFRLIQMRGQVAVRYSYEFDGVEYHGVAELDEEANDSWHVGDEILLLVDSRKLARSTPLCLVFSDAPARPSASADRTFP